MKREKTVNNALSYYIPQHGKPKNTLHIPESHSLHVCPAACGRRTAIKAIRNQEKDAISFLYITKADVVSGYYEEIIGDAIDDLLVILPYTPKAFLIYLNCIDDFLGTDEQALLKRLAERFGTLRFTVCHINPVAKDARIDPGMLIHNRIYEILEYSGKKDDGVNFIGNYVSVDPDSELFQVLNGWGIHRIRQIFDCQTFEEFQNLADSKLNLVMMPMGKYAAENMAHKLDIPYIDELFSCDINGVIDTYRRIARVLEKPLPDLKSEIDKTIDVIKATKSHIGDIPIVVDSFATMRPFSLARALLGYGFKVRAVFVLRFKNIDKDDREWLMKSYPEIEIVISQSYETILGLGISNQCIAIGFDSAFTLQARYFVDIRKDEGLYGLQGIRKVMSMISEAYDHETAWPARNKEEQ